MQVYAFLSQIVPYADPDLEMLYSYGRFLLPHLPLERDATVVKVGDEVALQYYRLERVFSGAIMVKEGEAEGHQESRRTSAPARPRTRRRRCPRSSKC